MAMWATTKRNPKKYHAVYLRNDEPTAVCNKSVKVPDNTTPRDGAGELCMRCVKREDMLGRPVSDSERRSSQDPTVVGLIEAGYTAAMHDLVSMARIVRGWLADDIDPYAVDGMLDFIASRHVRT